MQKILDKELAKFVEDIIKASKNSKEAAEAIVEGLRRRQDAGGMKVCQH